jgi:hypothetical protein
MIYCTERKIGVFLNPKVGSTTIVKAFKDVQATFKKQTHLNYTLAAEAYALPDFDKYKFFCFYRDPVSRFDSAFKFYKRHTFMNALSKFSTKEEADKAHAQIRKKIYDDFLFEKKYYPGRYHWLSDETKSILESITLEQIMSIVPALDDNPSISEGNITLAYQKRWFDHNIDITYLDFADYGNELRRLLSFFDATIDTIPHENENINLETDVPFTTEERNLIMQKYQIDYDFFASKGITF